MSKHCHRTVFEKHRDREGRRFRRGFKFFSAFLTAFGVFIITVSAQGAVLYSGPDPLPKADGYAGIWYGIQPQADEYAYKYSGGMGTFCAKHDPFAIYSPVADKTFFVYGGTDETNSTLYHMVSYYDHQTGMVSKPRILLDKETTDAHDNPVISIDDQGYIWIFSSTHADLRQSYLSRSQEPYSIDKFVNIDISELDNRFNYPQPAYFPGQGFALMYTRYNSGDRDLYLSTSANGEDWTPRKLLAQIEEGQYEVTGNNGTTLGSAFNMHPSSDPYFNRGTGANYRTNLYYMQTNDFGNTWTNAQGTPLTLPLSNRNNPALIHNYQAEGLNVYVKEVQYDSDGNPIILYLTSTGYESGPSSGPHTWRTARWTGSQWDLEIVTTSDNCYDMGSLYIESSNLWRIIGPTEVGPQPYNTGGEIAIWTSTDQGLTWTKEKQITQGGPYNHSYARSIVNGQSDFYAFWADGHGRQSSDSRLYFTDQNGDQVWRMPTHMTEDFARPDPVYGTHEAVYANAIQGATQKPVAYWRMEEITGTTVANCGTAAGLTGTIRGDTKLDYSGPHFAAPDGKLSSNSAVLLDGSGDYVQVIDPGTHSALDFGLGDSISLEAWVDVELAGSGVYLRCIASKGRTVVHGTNLNYAMRLSDGNEEDSTRLDFIFRNSTNTRWNRWTSDQDIESGWHHVVLTFTFGDGDSIAAYLDGVLQNGDWKSDTGYGNGDDAPWQDNDDLWIGSSQSGVSSQSFMGRIDEVAVYRYALSPEEVMSHYLAVPEPGTMILLGVAAFCLFAIRRWPKVLPWR